MIKYSNIITGLHDRSLLLTLHTDYIEILFYIWYLLFDMIYKFYICNK